MCFWVRQRSRQTTTCSTISLADPKIIQTRNFSSFKASQSTRALKFSAQQLRETAVITGRHSDWDSYRQVRNSAGNSLKADYRNDLSNKLEGKNSNQKWKIASAMSGIVKSGTPRALVIEGSTVSSPLTMAGILNTNYVEKIKGIRASLGTSSSDPCAGLKIMVRDKHLTNTWSIKVPTKQELRSLVFSMKSSASAGSDEVNMITVKKY